MNRREFLKTVGGGVTVLAGAETILGLSRPAAGAVLASSGTMPVRTRGRTGAKVSRGSPQT